MGVRIWIAILTLSLLWPGCGKAKVSPEDQNAIADAVASFYTKKDEECQATVKRVEKTDGGVEAEVMIKYPSFHSVSIKHRVRLAEKDGRWVVVRDLDE